MGHFHETLKEAHTKLLDEDKHQAVALMKRHRAEVLGFDGSSDVEMTDFQRIVRDLRFYKTDIDNAIALAEAGDLEKSSYALKGAINRLVEIKGHMEQLLQNNKLLGQPKIKLD